MKKPAKALRKINHANGSGISTVATRPNVVCILNWVPNGLGKVVSSATITTD